MKVRILKSLAELGDEVLDRITADSSIHLDRRWLRLIDAVDLATCLRGALDLAYAVAYLGDDPVAVCPFFRSASPTLYFAFSIDRFYLTGWQKELARVAPERAGLLRLVRPLFAAYRACLRATGALPRPWIMATSPLSPRGGIAVAAIGEERAGAARAAVIDALKGLAAEDGSILAFFGVAEDDQGLRRALGQASFDEVFFGHDMAVDLPEGGFSAYLDGFKASRRKMMLKEMEAVRREGIRFAVETDLRRLGPALEQLYDRTASKYNDEHVRHPPELWDALQQKLGPSAEAICAWRGESLVAFSELLHKRDLWVPHTGRLHADEGPVYFSVALYEPIRRAYELGATRVWFLPGAFESKRRRGALGHALYSCFWCPRVRSRLLLMPWIRAFGRMSEKELSFARRPSSYLKT